ncbi:hypothetical protein Goklo_002536 [Gossypium klotzschianum]|uniref:Uncharacterized protein n=1 Tax=Gossypium klotzschianum TaxID=34286 RepID=A0A7J8VU25_9ROSI|nr:hypothetical protein [Gossypium klotzschianum]
MNVKDKVRVNVDGLNMDDIEVKELSDSDDSETLNSAYESDSDGQNWLEFILKSDMNNPKLKVTRHKAGVHNQVVAPTHQEATPTYQEATLREKLSFKRKPVREPNIVRWMPSTQESSVLDQSMRL